MTEKSEKRRLANYNMRKGDNTKERRGEKEEGREGALTEFYVIYERII